MCSNQGTVRGVGGKLFVVRESVSVGCGAMLADRCLVYRVRCTLLGVECIVSVVQCSVYAVQCLMMVSQCLRSKE